MNSKIRKRKTMVEQHHGIWLSNEKIAVYKLKLVGTQGNYGEWMKANHKRLHVIWLHLGNFLKIMFIDMNHPWIYMCSPSRSFLSPPSPSHSSGSSQCTSPEHLSHASNLGWWSLSPWYYTCFNAILSEHPTLAFSHRV